MSTLTDDESWTSFGLTPEFLEERSNWLRDKRALHSSSLRFFETAASLVSFARYDYLLVSAAFFHGVLGLERALKLHFKDEEEGLRALLSKAISAQVIPASTFDGLPKYTREFSQQIRRIVGEKPLGRLESLGKFLPELRNQYFHGTYLLAPDYLHLTFQMRRMADALTTK